MTDQQLPDIEAIKQLKARYFRSLDRQEWETFGPEILGTPLWTAYPTAPLVKWVTGAAKKMRAYSTRPARVT